MFTRGYPPLFKGTPWPWPWPARLRVHGAGDHGHGLGGCGALVQQRGVGHFHPSELADQGLIVPEMEGSGG